MATHGSAFPIAKLALNNNVPPILMASLRMGMVMLLLIPFWKFKIPDKKYLKSLILFSVSMGVMVYVFMNLSLKHSSFISPIIIGAQLAVPFAVLLSAKMIGESISTKKWMYVILAFVGIIIAFFDPELKNNLLGLFFASLMALFFAIAQVYSRQLKELSLNKKLYDTNDFDISLVKGLSLANGTATLTYYTARILIAFFLANQKFKIILCGGGRKNKFLVSIIKSCNKDVKLIDDYGIDGDFVESQAFAYLAIRSFLKLPISFPETTGCIKPCTGGLMVKNF